MLFSFIKVKYEFWNHHTSKMGDFSLNPLKYFTETCKTYRNLEKPVTSVRFSFSVKFINRTFDKFNYIYYYFLLSGASIESHPEKLSNKKYFATNQLHCIFKGFSWVLQEKTQKLYAEGTISIERSFNDHQLFIETFQNSAYITAYHTYHSTVYIISYLNNQYFKSNQISDKWQPEYMVE